jgi:hypothetical protein
VEDGNIEFKKFQNFQVTSHERMEVLGTARKENGLTQIRYFQNIRLLINI